MDQGGRFSLTAIMFFVLCFLASGWAQNGTIANRETADPEKTGYARWIKITIKGGPGSNDNLDDNFQGMKFVVDLNLDFDNDESTHPEDVYEVRGSDGDIVSTPSGSRDYDPVFYLPIRGDQTDYWDGFGYPTHIMPRVKLETSGQLRVGTAPFQYPIGIDSGFEICMDGISPMMRTAFYYDDGSGNTAPVPGAHPGNMVAFDGHIDRIDIIWSEPMRTTNTAVLNSMFTGLGVTIYGLEPVGIWVIPDSMKSRFTFYVISSQANTGISPALSYTPPPAAADRFREASMTEYPLKPLDYAEAQSRAVTDRAGPVITQSWTTRAMRRQPLNEALTSRRIVVKFSEPILLSTVNSGGEGGGDFNVITTVTSPGTNNVTAIISPVAPTTSSDTYIFQLTTAFATGNEVGTIQFSSSGVVSDVLGNWNGQSNAPVPPPLPQNSNGLIIDIMDGIFPIITDVMTVDADYGTELASGGAWGWGYLDYIDVTFDHQMNTTRTSTSGFSITGRGIAGIAGSGVWVNNTTIRIPLVATAPKKANTGVIPSVSYTNSGDPHGMEADNGGDAEDLLLSDTVVSANNGLAVAIIDGAGPAVIYAITAGYRRIRIAFSEHVNTAAWPTTAGNSTIPSRFKWFVGSIISDPTTTRIFFTGLSATRRDSVVYLNHTGTQWAKTDSGGINFFTPGIILDANGVPNDQWDDDNTLLGQALSGSDVRIHADNIPPILLALETQDFNLNGKIDHYRCVFDDLSPIFPVKSFNPINWTITGYDGPKQNLMVDLNVYNPLHADYRPGAINAFGDTVEAYIKFDETTGEGPEETPYGGDTGDVPDVNVGQAAGFADWADNVMASLPNGLSIEMDRVGPAIMSAITINTTEVLAYMSELVMSNTIAPPDFFLDMGGFGVGWPILFAQQNGPGKIKITVQDQTYWLPTQTGVLSFSAQNVVTDDIAGQDNGNMQVGLINVNDHAASQFDINVAIPGNVIRGVPFQLEIIARDSHGEIDTNFPELVHISSNLTQNQIDLPDGAQRLNEGIGYFQATCWTVTDSLKLLVSVDNDRYKRFFSESGPIVVVDQLVDGPDTLIVRDYLGADGEGDQGGFVELIFDYSDNHPGFGADRSIDYYQVYREISGDVFHWATIEATDTTGTSADSLRKVVWTGDNAESRFWVRAVWDPQWPGMHGITPVQTAGLLAPPSLVGLDYLHSPALIRSQGRQVADKSTGVGTEDSDDQIISGSAMGIGRAVDNIAPLAPANLVALKEGVASELNWEPVTRGTNGTPELFDVKYEIYSHSTNAYFDPASEGTLVATVSGNQFTLNDGLLKCFYCVKAVDSDNQSTLSNRVGKYGYDIVTSEKPVYNYLSLPLEHSVILKAKNLAQDLGTGFDALYKLDPATNGYSIYYLPSLNFGTNFDLPTGSPVMVSATKNAQRWFYTGDVPAEKSVRFIIYQSAGKNIYNEITVPLDRTDLTTADKLAKDIGGVEVVLKLDPENGGFSHFWLPAITYGENFKILPGEPVLISVNESAPDVWPSYAPMQPGFDESNEDSE